MKELESALAHSDMVLSSITAALNGDHLNDFQLSIPLVRQVADLKAEAPDAALRGALQALVETWTAHAADLDKQARVKVREGKTREAGELELVAHAMRRDAADLVAVLRPQKEEEKP